MHVKVGVVQESPVFFDKKKTLEKLQRLAKKYAAEGCDLLVFPESYIPGYPRGFSFGTKVGSRTVKGRKLYAEYYANSIDIESDDLKFIEKVAKLNKVYLVVGITEKESINGSLYCAMLYISPSKGLLGVHRKIKPTGAERVIWSEADGEALTTFNTEIGRLGGLICWENYMPLARMAMYKKGVEIYLAPTADSRESWTTTMKHIAMEGRCFVIGCNQYFTKSMYPDRFRDHLKEEPEDLCRGGSIIVSPLGEVLEGPLFDRPGVLIANLNLNEIAQSKLDFDVVGHYARDDIFEFKAKGQPETKKE